MLNINPGAFKSTLNGTHSIKRKPVLYRFLGLSVRHRTPSILALPFSWLALELGRTVNHCFGFYMFKVKKGASPPARARACALYSNRNPAADMAATARHACVCTPTEDTCARIAAKTAVVHAPATLATARRAGGRAGVNDSLSYLSGATQLAHGLVGNASTVILNKALRSTMFTWCKARTEALLGVRGKIGHRLPRAATHIHETKA